MTGTIIVTGAGRGLGEVLSTGLVASGYAVVGIGRNAKALGRVEASIDSTGGVFVPVVGDARNRETLAEAVQAAEKLPGGLYGAIANAGIAGPTSPLEALSDEDWAETLEVNLTAVFRLFRESIPAIAAHGKGRLIVIGSVTGKRPLSGRTPYAASKLGSVGLARTLAVELGHRGITVNVISPWLLEGERLDHVINKQAELGRRSNDDVRRELVAGTATGRTVTNDDVLTSVEFLLDPRNSNFTGQDLNVAAGAVMY